MWVDSSFSPWLIKLILLRARVFRARWYVGTWLTTNEWMKWSWDGGDTGWVFYFSFNLRAGFGHGTLCHRCIILCVWLVGARGGIGNEWCAFTDFFFLLSFLRLPSSVFWNIQSVLCAILCRHPCIYKDHQGWLKKISSPRLVRFAVSRRSRQAPVVVFMLSVFVGFSYSFAEWNGNGNTGFSFGCVDGWMDGWGLRWMLPHSSGCRWEY